MAGLRYLRGVATLQLDVARCNGCMICLQVCPHPVFARDDKKVRIVDHDACMECGACALNCPEGALTVNAGVGCAAAVITGAIRGTEPNCCCDEGTSCCG
jgi:NAD-dependent dihydropyrimidine dehydrogenase PreA subunit